MNKKRFKNAVYIGIILFFGCFLYGFKKEQVKTEHGFYRISVEFPGEQIKVGRNTMKLTVIKYESGIPSEGKLNVEVIPWMPTHQHGTSEVPIIEEKGIGHYLVERLNFTMQGVWEVYFRINDGIEEDTAVISVNVH